MAQQDRIEVVTPRCLLSYPTLLEPEQARDAQGNPTGDPKYGGSFVFVKGTELAQMGQKALEAASRVFGQETAEKMIEDGSIRFRGGSHHTFRTDVASKGYPEGSTFVNARTSRKPGVVDATGQVVLSDQQVKELLVPGCVVRANLTPYWSDHPQNKGVYWALNHIQYLGGPGSAVDPRGPDGERFDSYVDPTDVFAPDEEAMADADLSDVTPDAEAQADEAPAESGGKPDIAKMLGG